VCGVIVLELAQKHCSGASTKHKARLEGRGGGRRERRKGYIYIYMYIYINIYIFIPQIKVVPRKGGGLFAIQQLLSHIRHLALICFRAGDQHGREKQARFHCLLNVVKRGESRQNKVTRDRDNMNKQHESSFRKTHALCAEGG
jgi:hypothetical protein